MQEKDLSKSLCPADAKTLPFQPAQGFYSRGSITFQKEEAAPIIHTGGWHAAGPGTVIATVLTHRCAAPQHLDIRNTQCAGKLRLIDTADVAFFVQHSQR